MTNFLLVAAAPNSGPSAFMQLVPLVMIFLVFYFIMWMPIRKKQKALEQLLDALKKGDRVVTNGGFYGEVVKTDDTTVILKLAENVKVKIAKRAIAGLEGSPEDQGVN
ncbi:MAG: preprotein translocase subunit YajC [Acidobacteriota bacterium]